MPILNAKIASTSLGDADYGIFTAWLHLEGHGWGVGFGGYGLDEYDKASSQRVDKTGAGLEFIRAILDTLEVDTWEELPGKHVRVDSEGVGGRCTRIGHLLKEQWFDPKAFFENYKNYK
jgi:hypothetical protein